jgi:hypothetical protein
MPARSACCLCSICTDIGNAVSTGLHYAYDFVVQPFVQTAQFDWACVSRGTHCAAAALNTGLMLLPVEGILGKDIALAASEASRGALRNVATSIGERVTGGLYRLATEETGSFDLSGVFRGGAEDLSSVGDQAAEDVASTTSLGQRIKGAASNLWKDEGGQIGGFGDGGSGRALGPIPQFGENDLVLGLSRIGDRAGVRRALLMPRRSRLTTTLRRAMLTTHHGTARYPSVTKLDSQSHARCRARNTVESDVR